MISFRDQLLGDIGQDVAATVGDFVIRRSDGVCAYQLAVVVDDALRASRTSCAARTWHTRHPARSSCSGCWIGDADARARAVVASVDRARLAKRDGAVSVRALRDAGADPRGVVGDLAASVGLVAGGSVRSPSDLVSVCGRIDPPWAS